MQNPPNQQGHGYGTPYSALPPHAPLSTPPGGGPKDKTGMGLDANIAALLSYIIGLFALILFLVEKENRFARFHALQSLFYHVAAVVVFIGLVTLLIILSIISADLGRLLAALFPLVSLAFLAGLIICAVKAYQGQAFKLPVVGDMAEKMINK